MRYWWVNQNQTFRQELAGGYLWSPKRNANGAPTMLELVHGTGCSVCCRGPLGGAPTEYGQAGGKSDIVERARPQYGMRVWQIHPAKRELTSQRTGSIYFSLRSDTLPPCVD